MENDYIALTADYMIVYFQLQGVQNNYIYRTK